MLASLHFAGMEIIGKEMTSERLHLRLVQEYVTVWISLDECGYVQKSVDTYRRVWTRIEEYGLV